MDQNYLPKGSLCENCVHCMKRIIEPLDYEAYGLSEDDEENVIVIQALCLISDVDLADHVVKECNKFDYEIVMQNKFLK